MVLCVSAVWETEWCAFFSISQPTSQPASQLENQSTRQTGMRMLSAAVLLAASGLGLVLASDNGAVGTVMIFVDDLRAEIGGPFGLDGTVKTPNLDRLASWGRAFRHAYTSIAICSPSRWATLSGLRPDTSRVWYIGPYLRETFAEGPNATTMPQAFKEAGIEMVQGAGKTLHPGSSSGGPTSSIGGADAPFSFKYDNQTTTHGEKCGLDCAKRVPNSLASTLEVNSCACGCSQCCHPSNPSMQPGRCGCSLQDTSGATSSTTARFRALGRRIGRMAPVAFSRKTASLAWPPMIPSGDPLSSPPGAAHPVRQAATLMGL
jgi:hypothetical protein